MRKFVSRVASIALIGLALPALAQTDGWERGGEYNKRFDPKSIVTVKGKVTKIDRHYHPIKTMEEGVAATIKTDKGDDIMVQVGPHWFTSFYKRKWDIKEGDAVQVTGSKVTMDGKPVIMVMQGSKGSLSMTLRSKTGVPVWDLKLEDF